MPEFSRKVGDAFRKVEERINEAAPGWNQKVAGATETAEREVKELISYMNEEVVPAIRSHSTDALRIASEKLSRLADYLDQQKKP